MLYWALIPPLVMRLNPTDILSRKSGFRLPALVGILAILCYLGLFRLVLALSGMAQVERASLSTDLIGKLQWLAREVVPNSLNLWNLQPSVLLSVIIGSVIVGGIVLDILRKLKGAGNRASEFIHQVGIWAMIAGCGFMAYLPNIITADNWAAYRTLLAPMVFVLLLVIFGIGRLLFVLSSQYANSVMTMILAALSIYGAYSMHQSIGQYLATPLEKEFIYVKSMLSELKQKGYSEIQVVRPNWADTPCEIHRYDEFGVATSCFPWGIESIAQTALRELGYHNTAMTISPLDELPENLKSSNDAVIDLRHLRDFY